VGKDPSVFPRKLWGGPRYWENLTAFPQKLLGKQHSLAPERGLTPCYLTDLR